MTSMPTTHALTHRAPLALCLLLSTVALADEDPLIAEAGAIAARVAELAGEPLDGPVEPAVVDQAGLLSWIQERMDEDEEGLAAQPYADRLLQRLAFLPPEIGSRDVVAASMAIGVGGVYDERNGRLLLVRRSPDASSSMERLVVAHETGHLIDDRRWDLSTLMEAAGDELDAQMVLATILEGSATVQMARFGWREKQAGRLDKDGLELFEHWTEPHTQDTKGFSPFLVDRLIAPYLLGQAVVNGGPVELSTLEPSVDPTRERLETLLKDPPRSMAALLHPERGDLPPTRVALEPVLDNLGWNFQHEERLGEMFVGTALGRPMPQRRAALGLAGWTSPAAAGWAGDQLVAAAREDGRAVDLWITAWETEEDRSEFVEAWGQGSLDGQLLEVRDRVAVVAWDLEPGEARQLKKELGRAKWSGGAEGWRP